MSGSAVAIIIGVLVILLAVIALMVWGLVKFKWVILPLWIAGKVVDMIKKKKDD